MTPTLTRDQADLLIRYTGPAGFASLAVNPAAAVSSMKSSMSGAATSEWWWNTDAKGVHATRYDPEPPWNDHRDRVPREQRHPRPVELTWTQMRQAAAAITDRRRTELGEALRTYNREVSRAWHPYGPGNYLEPWVAPPPEWRRDAEARVRALCVEAINSVTVADDLALFEVPA